MPNRSSSKAEVQGYRLFAYWGEVEQDSGYYRWYPEVFGPDGGFMPTDYLCKSLEEAQAYAETMMKVYGKYLSKPMPIDVKPIGESLHA